MQTAVFILGFILGILVMAFFILENILHRKLHEIQWHDAQKENPSSYVSSDGVYRFVYVLIATKKGVIVDSSYYPDIDRYDYEDRDSVTHFAYIEEIRRTVPPCPVCGLAMATESPFPYADQSTL